VDLFPDVREDLERMAAASYCTELVKELVENEESSPEIFGLMHDTFKFLSSGASAKRALRIFEVKLFDLLGLMPEVKVCVFCRAALQGTVYFNAGAGGVHCRDCGEKRRAGARHAVAINGGGTTSLPVSRGTLNFLDHVKRVPVSGLASVKVSQEVGEELEKILRRFTDFHLSHKLKTLTFMEKIGF
jgi:DNA repair protein RecO (recombination protein O)